MTQFSNPKMVEVKCQCCKTPFMARVADRKRGWGKFCSKSCKAIKQTQKTGRGAPREHAVGSLRALGYNEPGSYADYLESVHPYSDEAFS